MPTFTPHQDAALKSVAAWLEARPGSRGTPQIFRLFGYAGTGKTTLARHLAEGVDGEVAFGAFTGKAALVMRRKGCADASTIHSMIYRARDSGEETPSFELWDEAPAAKASLIVIDECSMVDAELGRDLLSFGVPVLVLGDPARASYTDQALAPADAADTETLALFTHNEGARAAVRHVRKIKELTGHKAPAH